MEHFDIVVSGKVQGVWFRQSTLNKAMELGINGYTMNLEEGNVYIEAEGDLNKLDLFIDWCRLGPQNAIVTDVIFTKSKHKGFKSFQIVK